MCKTCGHGGGQPAWSWTGKFDAPSPSAVLRADQDSTTVYYVGKRAGMMTYTVNGNRYQAGNNTAGKVIKVRNADVLALLAKYRGEFSLTLSEPSVSAESEAVPLVAAQVGPETGEAGPEQSPVVETSPVTEEQLPDGVSATVVGFDIKGLGAKRKNLLAEAKITTLQKFVMLTTAEIAQILRVSTDVATGYLEDAVAQLQAGQQQAEPA